jgi:hypothetical protein
MKMAVLFGVEKQIPPLRCGMITKEQATAKANANTGILRCAQNDDL